MTMAQGIDTRIENYFADCAESARWRESQLGDEERIPWWIRGDISLLEEMAWLLCDAPIPPTEHTFRAVHMLYSRRLKHLGIGMKQAQMGEDETIDAYMARIGIAQSVIADTLAKRSGLQAEISDYWCRAIAYEAGERRVSA